MEQPDELIVLAWKAGVDRMSVIREGTNAARMLLAGERNELRTLLWPVPRPLEAVSLWSANAHPISGIAEGLRPFASAVIPGCIIGALVANFLVMPRLSELGAKTAIVGVIVATIAVLGVVLKVLIGASLKRRVARLDEEAALEIVLDALRAGMRRNAARIERACVWIRRGLQLPAVSNQL